MLLDQASSGLGAGIYTLFISYLVGQRGLNGYNSSKKNRGNLHVSKMR